MIDIPGYQCFRKDRNWDRYGGVLIYIKDKYKCQQVDLDTPLECLALKVTLSCSMNFTIVVLYNQPPVRVSFYDELSNVVKQLESHREVIWYGDFNINWLNKTCREKLQSLMAKFNYTQMIKGPTRISRKSKTLIDMVFTKRPERIIRTYNLITGLSDHNMILTARKLTKKRLKYFGKPEKDNNIKLGIPKSKTLQFERELKNLNWEQIVSIEDVELCCNSMTAAITKLIEKFTQKTKCNQHESTLPWLNTEIKKLMKMRDMALKKSLRSKLTTDILAYKSLRNKVVLEQSKSFLLHSIN